VYVKPRLKEFRIVVDGDEIVVFCREKPVKGKVNRELLRELLKIFPRKSGAYFRFQFQAKKAFDKKC